MHVAVFVMVYALAWIGTYFTWLASAIGFAAWLASGSGAGLFAGAKLSVLFYAVAILACLWRGHTARRKFLWAFPFVAGLLDILVPFLPLAPTALMIVGLVFGCLTPRATDA